MTPTDTQDEVLNTASSDLAPQEPAAEASTLATGHAHHHPAPALNPELTRTVEVEAPAADVDKAYRRIFKRYAQAARIPGFRAGKVPESLIRSRFAKEVRQEVLDSLVSERFRTALEQGGMNPVSQPQVSELQLVEGQPLRFKATFEILPEINIDGYETVSVQKPEISLSDEEFQNEVNAIVDHHATVEPVEEARPLADGDWAEIRFQGQMKDLAQTVTEEGASNSTEQPEIKGDDILLEIGGKNTLQAFSDALRGTTVGQELSFEVDYPADFGDQRLAGKTVSYEVTVKAIKRKIFPERDEEFAKQLGEFESWQAFEDQLRERATSRKKETAETEARDGMLDQLIARFEFPVPETFVQQQVDARLQRGLRALAQQGMTEEAMRRLDFVQLRAAQRDQALAEVKASLLLDRIAEREGIQVADDELERELLMLSLQSREPVESLRKRLEGDGTLVRIREQMRREKTGVALYEKLAA